VLVSDSHKMNRVIPTNHKGANVTAVRKKRPDHFVGNLVDTNIMAVNKNKTERVFVTRVDSSCSGDQFCNFVQSKSNVECRVFQIKTKHDSYNSFVIETPDFYLENLLLPDMWPKRLLVRKFIGRFNRDNSTEIFFQNLGLNCEPNSNAITLPNHNVHNSTIIDADGNDSTLNASTED
jgi:hypothetical protein